MESDRRRRHHQRLPKTEHRPRGPVPWVGRQTALAIPVHVRVRIDRIRGEYRAAAVARAAYALGRGPVLAHLADIDATDPAPLRCGLTSIAFPVAWIDGWPETQRWSGASCTRRAITIGLKLLEFEFELAGWITLLDERQVEIIAAEHHPDRYLYQQRNEAMAPPFKRSRKVWM